jgi:uncharacterized OB-fold protein
VTLPSFAPVDTGFTRPFWDGVAAGEIRLPRCPACGTWVWYPLPGVGHCRDASLEWRAISPVGTVFTHTTVRRPFLPGADKTSMPFTTILVEFDDAPGVRLVGVLAEGVEPAVGMQVAADFYAAPDSRHSVRFQPVP